MHIVIDYISYQYRNLDFSSLSVTYPIYDDRDSYIEICKWCIDLLPEDTLIPTSPWLRPHNSLPYLHTINVSHPSSHRHRLGCS